MRVLNRFSLCTREDSRKKLEVRFTSTRDQVVDGFAKALPVKNLHEFKRNLNLVHCLNKGGC
jgi:hypothetical protein